MLFSSLAFGVSTPSITYLAKVNHITQDNKGYIWLSGHQGLTRYDSNNSITFSSNDAHWKTPFSWVHELEPYGDDFIVATENNGSWLFDPVTGLSEPLNIQTEKESHYHTIALGDDLYTYSGLKVFKYNRLNGNTQHIADTKGTAILAKANNQLYMAQRAHGLAILKKDEFFPILTTGVNKIVAIGKFLVAVTSNNIHIIKDDKITQSLAIESTIYGLAQEHNKDNFFTISDSGEIKKYHAPTLQELKHGFANARKGRVKAAYHDSSNVLWLASNFGIETIGESAIKNHDIVFNLTTNANEITTINNELIIGSYGKGLQKFSASSAIFPNGINQSFTANGLRIMDVVTVDNTLFIATFDGVWQYDSQEQTLSKLPFSNNDKLLLKLFYLDGLLYIGSNNHGLFIYDVQNNQILDNLSSSNGLISNEVIDIHAFENGEVWLATAKGVSVYNRYSKAVKNIPSHGPGKVISLAYANDKIFAATLGDGIYIYDRSAVLLSIIAKGIEFTYSSIINNEIWVGAALGLYIVDPKTHSYNLFPGTEKYSFSGEAHTLGNTAYLAHYSGIIEIPIEKPPMYDAKVYIGKTIVSGEPQLSNKSVKIDSSSDVVTLDLASLDFRPGQRKLFKYKINSGTWNDVNGSQLTLTGLASGSYQIEVMATNSLGQWSSHRAFANIDVAYPWYWTIKMRTLYIVTFVCIVAMLLWIFYLRAQSIRNIHTLLEKELKQKGKHALLAKRNIQQTLEFIEQGDISCAKDLLKQSLAEVQPELNEDEPNNLYGKPLTIALPYFAEYLHRKYHVNLKAEVNDNVKSLPYELQSNLYKVIYEAITCGILHGDGRNFNVTLQEFKQKLWLTITDDESSFASFNNKVTFNMSMYYIRQIANIYNATVNTFEPSDDKGSQIVLSFPLTPQK